MTSPEDQEKLDEDTPNDEVELPKDTVADLDAPEDPVYDVKGGSNRITD